MTHGIAIGLVAMGMFAAGCPAPLGGAPCPCVIEQGYVCVEGLCVRTDNDPDPRDAASSPIDASLDDAQTEQQDGSVPEDAGDPFPDMAITSEQSE